MKLLFLIIYRQAARHWLAAAPRPLGVCPMLGSLILLAGCGSGSSGVRCQNQHCPAGTLCCLQAGQQPSCSTSCPQNALAVACDGPADCASGSYCCDEYSLSPEPGLTCTTSPNLDISGTIACASSCLRVRPPDPNLCGGSGADRLCGTAADCTGNSGNTNCCSSTDNGAWWSICVDDATRASVLAANGSCT
jgi:hypothetical protein